MKSRTEAQGEAATSSGQQQRPLPLPVQMRATDESVDEALVGYDPGINFLPRLRTCFKAQGKNTHDRYQTTHNKLTSPFFDYTAFF
jgi:hypothetical protein